MKNLTIKMFFATELVFIREPSTNYCFVTCGSWWLLNTNSNNKLPAVGRPYILIFIKSFCNLETESLFYLCIELILERYKLL